MNSTTWEINIMSKKQLSESVTFWDALTKAIGRVKLATVKRLAKKDKELARITKDLEKARKDLDKWTNKYRKSRGKDFHIPDEFKRMGIK